MAKKFGLGNGLDSLLGPSKEEKSDSQSSGNGQNNLAEVKKTNLPAGIEQDDFGKLWINPELLRPNPYQPRIEFDETQLKELADSIKENGVIQPITIEDARDGTFTLLPVNAGRALQDLQVLLKFRFSCLHSAIRKNLKLH